MLDLWVGYLTAEFHQSERMDAQSLPSPDQYVSPFSPLRPGRPAKAVSPRPDFLRRPPSR